MEEFYLKFENLFRGSRENVKQKLTFYLPLIKAFSKVSKENLKALDLGCGRGEFLEILSSLNIEVEGIDINDANISFCFQRGFKVKKSDALKYLKEVPSEYFHMVSLIQVAEHLEFTYLLDLFNEVYRVLKANGIFIVELPYIKNPYVGLHYFWLDPTHLRPLPHELLIFLGKNTGFESYKFFIINPIGFQEKVDFLNLLNFFKEIGGDISIIFFKKADIIGNKEIYNALKYMESKSNISFEYALQLYSYYSNIPMQNIYLNLSKLNRPINKLNILRRKIKFVYNTKFRKFYGILSSFKEKIKLFFLNFLRIFLVKTSQNPFLRRTVLLFLDRNPRIKNTIKKFLSKINNISQGFSDDLDIEEKFFLKKIDRFKKNK